MSTVAPPYSATRLPWPEALPPGWTVARLKRVASMRSGEGITAEEMDPDGAYPVYGGNGIRGRSQSWTHDGTYVLIGRQGALCGNVHLAEGRFWASEHAVVTSPCSGFSIRWLEYLLRVMRLAQYSLSAAQPGLAVERILDLHVPIPPIHEQHAIADFLLLESEAIGELRIEARAMADGVIAESSQRLRGLVLGKSWPLAPLKYYARTGTGHTPSRTHPEYWTPDECVVPWFTLADVNQIRDGRVWTVERTSERVSDIGLANSSAQKHPAGTVLLSRTASVGFSAVMGTDMAVSQDFMTWTCGPELDPYYLLIALRAMQPELRRLMYGSTHKTIYMPDLHALRIPIPSIQDQEAIVREARERWSVAWALRDELLALDQGLVEYEYALMTQAVMGSLRIERTANRESEHGRCQQSRAQPEVLSA